MPKKACQIHKSLDAIGSSMMVTSLKWPWYISCKLLGQLFHWQCMQSTERSIPGKPLCCSNSHQPFCILHSWFSQILRSYCHHGAGKNLTLASRHVLSPVRTISPMASVSVPNANIFREPVHFCNGENESCPQQSFLRLKEGSCASIPSPTWKNKGLRIRKRLRKNVAGNVGPGWKWSL